MKGLRKIIPAAVMITCVLWTGTLAFGADVSSIVTALVNSVTVMVDGKKMPTDNIVYGGNLYIRADKISEQLGKGFSWDKKKKTASIYTKSPPVTPPKKEWKQVAAFEGSSAQDTEVFRITSTQWCIEWDTAPKKGMDASMFLLIAHNKDGSLAGIVTRATGASTSKAYMKGTGEYYLSISSVQTYTVTITEYR